MYLGEDGMTIVGRGRKGAFRVGYFDRFWGCPGCRRILSIAEIIERHCEDCNAFVQPVAMADSGPRDETPGPQEKRP